MVLAAVVVAAAAAAAAAAVVVFVRDCSCPGNCAQRNLCYLALLVEFEPRGTPKGTTTTKP